MSILLKAILLTVFMTTTVLAAEHNGSGKYSINTPHLINIEYKWKLWTLMGEPVDELVARWNIQSVNFHRLPKSSRDKLKNPVTNSLYYEVCYDNKEYKGCIPKSIMEKTRIVEMKFIGSSNYGYGYNYKFDAGVMSKPYISNPNAADNRYGKWSYNTPGSKSWDESFGNLTAAESKKIMKSGVKLPYFNIDIIRLDLTEVMIYIIDRNKKHYKSKNIKKSYSALEKRLKKGAVVMDKRLQATKDRIVKRTLPTKKDRVAKSTLPTKKDRVAKNTLPTKKAEGVHVGKYGFMWEYTQKNSVARGSKKSWHNAIKYCKRLELSGYSDWILPDSYILGRVNKKRKALNIYHSSFYWSSSEDTNYPSLGRLIHGNGDITWKRSKNEKFYVRCVRKI